MRRSAAALLLALTCCFAVLRAPGMLAQRGDALTVMPHDALELVKVLTAQERAWNEGDLPGFLSGYKTSPETTFVSGTVQHGFDEMAAHYKGSYPSRETMGTLPFRDMDPRLLDERIAVMTGRYSLERGKKFGGNASGVFSLVFE